MGTMAPVLCNLTLSDISLPGTHDSLTYDLSEEVSLGADDDSPFISWVLHWASKLGVVPGGWIRSQARTQGYLVGYVLHLRAVLINRIGYYSTAREWREIH
jgi:hypothetical protein